ncbi:MAG: M15 family metallopeptidase [Defluviitaleaceae bacterium]|nr:M15 family metallopeptidase [Defluviitaleaceae bacterium]MCL2274792.1 M15 family metallopeptidase [Defluviitaleaceae bacterium]
MRRRRGLEKSQIVVFIILAAALIGVTVWAVLIVVEGFRMNENTPPAQELVDNALATPSPVPTVTPIPAASPTPSPTPTPEPTPEPVNPFLAFAFSASEKLEMYERFHARYPNLAYDEVVWKVNAGLYYAHFENPQIHDLAELHPLVVNPFFRLHDDFEPHALVQIPGLHFRVTPETLTAFNAKNEAAREAGHTLQVISTYRDIAHQRRLWNASGDGAVARPGHSEHHTGRAIDYGDGAGGFLDIRTATPMGRWLADNAHRFGFILRYTEENTHITGFISEPWHFTYVGYEIANAMFYGAYESLEEYTGRNPDAQARFTRHILAQ